MDNLPDEILDEAQAILDKGQIEFAALTSTERTSAWFSACLNSACGAVGSKYGDVAVFGLLKMWMDSVQARIKTNEIRPN